MNNEERYAETSDDVEGHRAYSTSDRNVKDSIEPVAWDEKAADDVEGHGRHAVDPQAGEDDVEGHARMHVDSQAAEDDVEGHARHL